MEQELELFGTKTAETRERALNVKGTVRELIGAEGDIFFNEANLKESSGLVLVDLVRGHDKAEDRVWCSGPLSNKIRAEKKPLQELVNYVNGLQIAVTTNDKGEKRLKIVPFQGAKVGGKATELVDSKPKSKSADDFSWI